MQTEDLVRARLAASASEETRTASQHFFREPINVYGVKAPVVQNIGKDVYAGIRQLTKKDIFDICENLWLSGYMEEAMIACYLSEKLSKKFEPSDFQLFEYWIKNYISNWATCDTLCNHTIGNYLMMYPEYVSKLKEFAYSENRWVKRASAVSLIIPARKGLFQDEVFELSDILLTDKDDMVQKGYGWMLKSASQYNPQAVFDYVMSKKSIMPRTALRYAIEKMPVNLKALAMKK